MLNVSIARVLNMMIMIRADVQNKKKINIIGIDARNFNGRISI
jgi:hypothetical protein